MEFAIKKTQTDTDISVPEVQKKRKPKRKNLDDYMTTELSDNSESQRMTPPPKLPTLCGMLVKLDFNGTWRSKLFMIYSFE